MYRPLLLGRRVLAARAAVLQRRPPCLSTVRSIVFSRSTVRARTAAVVGDGPATCRRVVRPIITRRFSGPPDARATAAAAGDVPRQPAVGGEGVAAAATAAKGSVAAVAVAAPSMLGIVDPFRSFYQLSKPVLSALVVSSGVAGFLMAGSPFHFSALAALTCGTFLTAFSANTFNQCYEVRTDALMKRTRNRPLPAGNLTRAQAGAWGVLCGAAGAGVLAAGCNDLVALLGVGNIALYSMVYTPMKQKSILNTWVGSVVGAIPPLMGWAAATGNLWAMEPVAVAGVLYLWQFPHFFALAWRGRHDYKAGGHVMVPCLDKTGEWTAQIIQKYALYLAALPCVTTGLGLTNEMFLLESAVFNGVFLWQCARFGEERTTRNAQKIFRHSLWYLPVVLALMVYHSRNWDRDRDRLGAAARSGAEDAQTLEAQAEAMLEDWRGRLLEYCPHEVLKTLNIAVPESRAPNYCPAHLMDDLTGTATSDVSGGLGAPAADAPAAAAR